MNELEFLWKNLYLKDTFKNLLIQVFYYKWWIRHEKVRFIYLTSHLVGIYYVLGWGCINSGKIEMRSEVFWILSLLLFPEYHFVLDY